jgi:hypothetical protein
MSTTHSHASWAPARVPLVAALLLVAVLGAVVVTWAVTHEETRSQIEKGSGTAVTETRHVGAFTEVELAGASTVTIGVGGEQQVVVRADDNLVDEVTTEVRGGMLVVGSTGSFETVVPMTVRLTVPSLDAVGLSGSGSIAVDGHELDALAVVLSGSGTIRGAGSVTTLDVDLSGAGNVELEQLHARDAAVDVSGTGSVVVHVTGTLDADVSGTGSVVYTGGPDRVSKDITGTGSVTGT